MRRFVSPVAWKRYGKGLMRRKGRAMALIDLFERVMTACGSPCSPAENHEGTATTLANTGCSPCSPGSPEKMECTETNHARSGITSAPALSLSR
jgi:hypothetical protein